MARLLPHAATPRLIVGSDACPYSIIDIGSNYGRHRLCDRTPSHKRHSQPPRYHDNDDESNNMHHRCDSHTSITAARVYARGRDHEMKKGLASSRSGASGEGGARCVFYSFGISNDWSFDSEYTARYGCDGVLLDPTVSHRALIAPHLIFLPLGATMLQAADVGGAGAEDRSRVSQWILTSPPQLSEFLGQSHLTIGVLKMDCEGCEYAIARDVARYEPRFFSRVEQFAVEIHLNTQWLPTPQHVHNLGLLYHMLIREGFGLAEAEISWCAFADEKLPCPAGLVEVEYPCYHRCHNLLFVNTRYEPSYIPSPVDIVQQATLLSHPQPDHPQHLQWLQAENKKFTDIAMEQLAAHYARLAATTASPSPSLPLPSTSTAPTQGRSSKSIWLCGRVNGESYENEQVIADVLFMWYANDASSPTVSDMLIDVLVYALHSRSHRIHLLTNQDALIDAVCMHPVLPSLRNLFVFNISTLVEQSSARAVFIHNYAWGHQSGNDYNKEAYCFWRWFIMNDYVSLLQSSSSLFPSPDRVIVSDSDVLILSPLHLLLTPFLKYDMVIFIPGAFCMFTPPSLKQFSAWLSYVFSSRSTLEPVVRSYGDVIHTCITWRRTLFPCENHTSVVLDKNNESSTVVSYTHLQFDDMRALIGFVKLDPSHRFRFWYHLDREAACFLVENFEFAVRENEVAVYDHSTRSLLSQTHKRQPYCAIHFVDRTKQYFRSLIHWIEDNELSANNSPHLQPQAIFHADGFEFGKNRLIE